jgi:hypothetical protein
MGIDRAGCRIDQEHRSGKRLATRIHQQYARGTDARRSHFKHLREWRLACRPATRPIGKQQYH